MLISLYCIFPIGVLEKEIVWLALIFKDYRWMLL